MAMKIERAKPIDSFRDGTKTPFQKSFDASRVSDYTILKYGYEEEQTMEQAILRPDTVEAIQHCVHSAVERHGFELARELRDMGLVKELNVYDHSAACQAFDGLLKTINWTNPKSIVAIIPIFENAYAETPRFLNSIHTRVDLRLAHDGFGMRDGRLIRLAM